MRGRRRRPPRALPALPLLLAAGALAGCAAPQVDLGAFYEREQQALLAQGRLRTELAPADAPYDRARLVRDFNLVVFHTEFPQDGAADNSRRLSKWREKATWRMLGDDLPPQDLARMRELSSRISEATGLDMREAGEDEEVGLLILTLSPEERGPARDVLAGAFPDTTLRLYDRWLRDPSLVCFGVGMGRRDQNWTDFAFIGVRAELPDLWRAACIDEEVSQAMGLVNDDDSIRPSIFNDDQEFAYLTEHDLQLMRILYDPRLRPGMTEKEAAPIVRRIVAEMPLPGHR